MCVQQLWKDNCGQRWWRLYVHIRFDMVHMYNKDNSVLVYKEKKICTHGHYK